ncbi:MAG: alpha/beta fold hydrolase [bacterium]
MKPNIVIQLDLPVNKRWLIAAAFLVIAGCTTIQKSSTIRFNNNQVEFVTKGEGRLTVVFETGLGVTMDTWEPILDRVASFTKVFAYNRPGYGKSKVDQKPESAGALARNLRYTLRQTGHEPPYILIGHSAGGVYLNVFARTYSNDVAGMVLIDSSHPDQFEYFRTEKPALYAVLVASTSVGNRRYEMEVLNGLAQEVHQLGPFPEVHLTVLTAEKSSLFETKEMRRKWLFYQQDLASLTTDSKHEIVPDSSHFIHKSQPGVVIQTIREIVDTVNIRGQ